MSSLTKTTVYLPEQEYRQLKAMARREGRSAAELLREAVRAYARRGGATRSRSIASGRSGRSDLSERAEELLKRMGRPRG